jgi:hypothetical protein
MCIYKVSHGVYLKAGFPFCYNNFCLNLDMQKVQTSCNELIEETAQAIDNQSLKLLFISVQQNNIDLCVKSAIE